MIHSWKRSILLIIIVTITIMAIGGCGKGQQAQPQPKESPAAATMNIKVYYGNRDATDFVPEVKIVPKNDKPIETALYQLLTPPTVPDAVALIPAGTTVKGYMVKDQIAYVDLGGAIAKASGGSAQENLLVMSIVNTLTEFKEIEQVQILIEGKVVETLYGHLSLDHPLSRSFPARRFVSQEGWSFEYPGTWDKVEPSFVQEIRSGKTVEFRSRQIGKAELEQWIQSEINRKLAATEAENKLMHPLKTETRNGVIRYSYTIQSRMESSAVMLKTVVLYDGKHMVELRTEIPRVAEAEFEQIIRSFTFAKK